MAGFVRGSNPVWYLVDLDANAFDDTFYLFVLQNTLPYLPATVYESPNGIELANPIQFLGNGTLPVDIFYDPDVVYRLEFRRGNTQQDPLIYLIENYTPGGSGSSPNGDTSISSDNQITNAQFALIDFVSPTTLTSITNPDPIQVAPGWLLNLTGTGTVVLTRVALSDSTSTINPTNAPYALQITLTGTFTGAYLSQVFEQNGNLWSSGDLDRYLASSVTARVQGASASISAVMVNSQNEELTTVLTSTPVTEDWNEFTDLGQMPQPLDGNTPPASYIEYRLILPVTVDIFLTSFQLISEDLAQTITYNQDSIQRQIDHTFHYYKPQLAYKPVPSFLVGWDFPLNPAQFLGRSVSAQATGANSGFYAWDQTIVYQTVTSSVAITADDAGNINLSPNTTTQIGLIQYLAGNEVKNILDEPICVNVRALANQSIGATISLWYTKNASLPTLPTTFISTLDANGKPATVASGWIEVTKRTPGNAYITIPATTGLFENLPASGWDLANIAESEAATFFAIAVCTAPITNTNNVVFSSISCQSGTIPTTPSKQTIAQVLQDCQYYYESSYPIGVIPGTAIQTGQVIVQKTTPVGAATTSLIGAYFSIVYQTVKKKNPVVTFYSADTGTINRIFGIIAANGANAITGDINISVWTAVDITTKVASYFANTAVALLSIASATVDSTQGYIEVQYTIDARLGVV